MFYIRNVTCSMQPCHFILFFPSATGGPPNSAMSVSLRVTPSISAPLCRPLLPSSISTELLSDPDPLKSKVYPPSAQPDIQTVSLPSGSHGVTPHPFFQPLSRETPWTIRLFFCGTADSGLQDRHLLSSSMASPGRVLPFLAFFATLQFGTPEQPAFF